MDKAIATYYVSITVKPSSTNLRFSADTEGRLKNGLKELYTKLGIAEEAKFTMNENSIDLKVPVVDDGRIGIGVRITDIVGEVTAMLDILIDHGKNSDLFNQLIGRYEGLRSRRGFNRVTACWDSLELMIDEVLTKTIPLTPQEVRIIKKKQDITQSQLLPKVSTVETTEPAVTPLPVKLPQLVPNNVVTAAERSAPLPPSMPPPVI